MNLTKRIQALLVSLALIIPTSTQALLGVGDIVFDPAAVAQLIEQVQRVGQMISQLKSIYKGIDKLTDWQEIDHINLAGGKFGRFLNEYTQLFDSIMDEIEGYQSGGLMGQLDRLDQVYWAYYDGWESNEVMKEAEDADPLHRELAKQILWTRIQFKHAAKVGAKIRETLPRTQEQINVLLDDTAQAVGIMQSIKIGNQLTGTVAKSLQTLNVSLTEHLQAQSAQGLEQNQKEGLKMNRAREAIKDWSATPVPSALAPRNPFENF
jgi:conjugal transfer/entry exclusion protein